MHTSKLYNTENISIIYLKKIYAFEIINNSRVKIIFVFKKVDF